MNNIIGAEAAAMAGLQIDLLQKMRQGQVTLEQLAWWLNLSKGEREALAAGSKPSSKTTPSAEPVDPPAPTGKFALLVDLGTITVPDDYDHATALESFRKKNHKKFYYYNDEIIDKHFPNPTRILKPGDKLRVRAFQQVVPGTTTSEERLAFLVTQKAIHTGAQGATIVLDQKRDQLPKGKWYTSFDEPNRLWKDADGSHRVPRVSAGSGGDFHFNLGSFESVWSDGNAFLCFCDE